MRSIVLLLAVATAVLAAESGLGGELSEGARFHEQTKLSPVPLTPTTALPTQDSVRNPLTETRMIALPQPLTLEADLTGLLKERKSIRSYTEQPISLAQLATILWATDGLNGQVLADGSSRRTAPSAGALYPLELYVVARKVDSLPAGLYHYNFERHALEELRAGDLSESLSGCLVSRGKTQTCAAAVVVTAVFARTTSRYDDRGYRYIYMESGHVGQNLCLACTALGLGTVTIGAFYDDRVNQLVGVDGRTEGALYMFTVGRIE